MSNRVLNVGGLADATSECQLRDLLGTYGVVASAHVVRHKHGEKSAGYGFVEMGSSEQALTAVIALEGALFEGNVLRLYVTTHVSMNSQVQPIGREEMHQ
jgi:RNA recognition motif-containing protein